MNKPFYDSGVFVTEIISQGLTKASTGTTQFVLRFKVLGKPDPSDPTALHPVTQYERTMYMPITEKTAERAAENLRQLGYQSDGWGALEPSHPQHESFVGQQVDMYCKHETDQSGEMRERWQLSRKLEKTFEPLESKEVRQLDMLFGKVLKRTSSPGKTATAPNPRLVRDHVPYEQTEITDDDIPF